MSFKDDIREAVKEALAEQLAQRPAANAQPVYDPLQLLTTEEVGQLIRYTAEGVRGLITSGRMQGMMTGAGWRVKRAWLEEWEAKQLNGVEPVADPEEEARRDVARMRAKPGR